jgi:hypothetical protein
MGNAEKANDATRMVFVTAFTFLAALTLRDVFALLWSKLLDPKSVAATKLIESADANTSTKKPPSFWLVALYQFLLFGVVLGIAVICAVFWHDYGELTV